MVRKLGERFLSLGDLMVYRPVILDRDRGFISSKAIEACPGLVEIIMRYGASYDFAMKGWWGPQFEGRDPVYRFRAAEAHAKPRRVPQAEPTVRP